MMAGITEGRELGKFSLALLGFPQYPFILLVSIVGDKQGIAA